MTGETVKVIIEVRGGIVQAVYCGAEERPLADVVLVDHDSREAAHVGTQAIPEFRPDECISKYDRRGNVDWVFK